MNKAELARELGVSRSYITMIEQGKRTPSKKLQKRISKLTELCSLPDTLLGYPKSCSSANSDTSPGTESSKYYSILPNLSQVICRQP